MIPWYVFAVRLEHDVGRPLIPFTLLAGGHCAPRRLPGPTDHARAWRATGYRHHFRRMLTFIVGDWALGNPALAVSCGSCGTSPWMPPDGHRVPDMLWSPSGFRRWVSQAIQEPPSEFLPAAPGIQRSASRRTPGVPVIPAPGSPQVPLRVAVVGSSRGQPGGGNRGSPVAISRGAHRVRVEQRDFRGGRPPSVVAVASADGFRGDPAVFAPCPSHDPA